MQPQLDRRRGWRHVREIGSPLRLARVVWTIPTDNGIPSPQAITADAHRFDAVKRTLRRYIFLRSMKRITSHYVESMALQPSAYVVSGMLDRVIGEEEKGGLIERAMADAKSAMVKDYDLRALFARKEELDTGRFDEILVEPGTLNLGINAFDVYRRGLVLERQGATEEAARMYRRALEADPDFSLALRQLAALEREKAPFAAARIYSDALEFVPKEYYGAPGALHALAVHRNFVIARWKDEFIAVPVAVGAIDFASPWLRSPLRRFIGLLLMRVRLRATGAPLAAGREEPAAAVSMPGAVSAVSAAPRRSLVSRVRPLAAAPVRWLLRNAYLFQFALTEASIDRLKSQIDKIDSAWLSRTAPVENA